MKKILDMIHSESTELTEREYKSISECFINHPEIEAMFDDKFIENWIDDLRVLIALAEKHDEIIKIDYLKLKLVQLELKGAAK